MTRIALVLACVTFGASADLRVSSDQPVGGFKFPESVAYDAKEKVLYVGNFGGENWPAGKDGLGYSAKSRSAGQSPQRAFSPPTRRDMAEGHLKLRLAPKSKAVMSGGKHGI